MQKSIIFFFVICVAFVSAEQWDDDWQIFSNSDLSMVSFNTYHGTLTYETPDKKTYYYSIDKDHNGIDEDEFKILQPIITMFLNSDDGDGKLNHNEIKTFCTLTAFYVFAGKDKVIVLGEFVKLYMNLVNIYINFGKNFQSEKADIEFLSEGLLSALISQYPSDAKSFDTNNDGYLDDGEKQRMKNVATIFNVMDVDDDGSLSIREIKVFNEMNDMSLNFVDIDKNGDGSVIYKELFDLLMENEAIYKAVLFKVEPTNKLFQ